jgi:hypothetical protein
VKKFLLISFLILTTAAQLSAGDGKYQILLMANPTLEWVHFRSSASAPYLNDLWGSKLSYNAGFEYKRFVDPSLSFSVGLTYMNKGFRNKVPYQTSGGQSDIGYTVGDMHVLAVPLYMNIHHRIKRKVEMIYTVGVSGGYLFAERVRNKNYTAEDIPENSLLSGLDGSNVNLFNNYYISADLGIGISTFVKSRVVLVLQPMFKYQVHNARDFAGQFVSSDPFTAHMNSFGVNIKMGYFFTKQIRNRRKDA